MISILKNPAERRVADIGIEHASDPSSKPVRLPSGTYGGIDGQSYAYRSGGTFFDFLFGGAQPSQSVYRPRANIGPSRRNPRR